jgi:hypothetical protein
MENWRIDIYMWTNHILLLIVSLKIFCVGSNLCIPFISHGLFVLASSRG